MSNIHFLVGVATKDFVVLASDKAAFMYGAILVSESLFIFFIIYIICLLMNHSFSCIYKTLIVFKIANQS